MPQFLPSKHGFDYFYGVPYSNDMDGRFYVSKKYQAPPLPVYRDDSIVAEKPDQSTLTKRYTEEAIETIKERGNKPFFIYLAQNMPHEPLHVSEKFAGKSKRGLYQSYFRTGSF